VAAVAGRAPNGGRLLLLLLLLLQLVISVAPKKKKKLKLKPPLCHRRTKTIFLIK
jgi:hypothetical protein